MAILSGCTHQSDKIATSYEVRELKVNLELTEPSYHELFDSCRIIKLESEPQSLLAGIDKAQCVNDSILLFDMRRSVVCLFAPDGQFLNRIGERGDGPEDYIMCY
ncbi:MAG: 6-bladed beta-propeller, partial [Duncaniella sp.]|nr:6-bladed beta-propeller [Duncaniella sp.]